MVRQSGTARTGSKVAINKTTVPAYFIHGRPVRASSFKSRGFDRYARKAASLRERMASFLATLILSKTHEALNSVTGA